MSQSPPTTIGKYQIIREIARSNDIVYEAYDPVMNRRVAVKELAVPGGATAQQKEERLKRFHREARAAGSLVHPNIVTVYEVGEEGGRHFIAMEFLDGHTLQNELDSHGFLPPDRAVEIATEVLEGLSFAHNRGVIHRDIKPANIQLLESGAVKITDFGIARLTFEPNLTMDGQVFGTPSYMSPEQINGRDLDLRSDLFSVGVILYEMLAGEKPFQGDNVVAITYAIMNREPAQPRQIPSPLWQVILRALEKSSSLRPRDAETMARDLRDALRQQQSGSFAPPAPAPPTVTSMPYGGQPAIVQAPPPVLVAPNPAPYTPQQINAILRSGQVPAANPYSPPPNPYATSQPYAAPSPVPVYYPPPPRAPMLKPGTKSAIGRFFVIMICLGILIWVVVTVFQVFVDSVSQNPPNLPNSGAPAGPKAAPANPRVDVEALVSRALQLSTAGDIQGALRLLQKTEAADRTKASVFMGYAVVYGEWATREPNQAQRSELWRNAASNWTEAIRLEDDPARRAQMQDSGSTALLKAAMELMVSGRTQEATEVLYQAQSMARPNSESASMIDVTLRHLGA